MQQLEEDHNSLQDDSFSLQDTTFEQNSLSQEVIFENEVIVIENKDIFKTTKLKLQFLSGMLSLFYIGLSDQIVGSLIEYIMKDYGINRAEISYLFVSQCFGYIPASILNNYLMDRFGLHKIYYFSCMTVTITSILFFLKSPFLLLIACSILNGASLSTYDCCLHYFVGNLKYSNQLLGIMHAMYGFGCLITPVLSTYLISIGIQWNYYFILASVTGLINFFLAFFLFKNETTTKYRYTILQERIETSQDSNTPREIPTIWEILKNKYVIYFSLILFIYVGAELSVGIWINNYLFRIKQETQEKASLITSTYWLFMTFGRLTMGFVTGRYFEDREIKSIIIYCTMVTLCSFIFWVGENSLQVQCISIFIAGWFVGPIFGTTIVVALKSLPKLFALNSISLIASFGGAGAAVIPFIVGYIAEYGGGTDADRANGAGLKYFPIVILVMFMFASILWISFYLVKRRSFDSKIRL